MEKQMESFKKKSRLSHKFSSSKSLGSLKTRFKKFVSDHHAKVVEPKRSSFSSSDSHTDGRKASSLPLARRREKEKSLSSSSSSDSDEGSLSGARKEEKLDFSSDSSSEEKRKIGPADESRKNKVQVHLLHEREEPYRLPSLEESPPTSPPSSPRFSSGCKSHSRRLWTHFCAPNSPANLTHNIHLNYRGGDSSPIALIHSLSARERGKHSNSISNIFFSVVDRTTLLSGSSPKKLQVAFASH